MQQTIHYINSEVITPHLVYRLVQENHHLALSNAAAHSINQCRNYLTQKIAGGEAFYGINTGFGDFKNVVIKPKDMAQLQKNLLLSHACGTGSEVPQDIVAIMLLLKVQSLSYGYSGVRQEVVERLIQLFNEKKLPVVYEQGSLGASGDLAPLSHLCLPLIGEGEIWQNNTKIPAASALSGESISLAEKEGLALINGTQFMAAYGVWCVHKAQQLCEVADFLAAFSLEAYNGRSDAFYAKLHQIRNQSGQITSAERIRTYLSGSNIDTRVHTQVQDPYSFRCAPQVHGASRDAVAYATSIITNEINSVTDNPNIFREDDEIISGGNFHGQPLALSLDFLAIALAELGNISERRVFKLLSGANELPLFLAKNGGLNSGLMIPQYTAAALVSQNKQYCSPASVDSITSSNGQEDHVSMGANAATKCYKVVENLERILAIELLTASQALGFREDYRLSPALSEMWDAYREVVPFNTQDRLLQKDILASVAFLQEKLPQYFVEKV
ncbi:MAG: histidine ammonia-lyase [Chitinophagales bacterium]|nr:histidine ammonia-lyase [Bacteroidota bacterium]